jgi:tight adherence protein C
MDVLLVQFLSFFAVLLFVLGVRAAIRGGKSVQDADDRPALFRWFGNEIAALGDVADATINRLFPDESRRIQSNLVASALNDHLSVRDVRGLQVFLAAVLGTTMGVVILLPTLNGGGAFITAFVFGLIGYVYPLTWLQKTTAKRKDMISKELPFAIDLLTVAMEAGQDFGAAVRHLVREVSGGPLRQEFDMMLRETDLGKSRIEAMRSMSSRIQIDEFQAVVTSVVQSSELGASVAAALKLHADEIRRTRFHRAERKAARAPSLMLMPVAMFILPSVFIIILTPIIMRLVNTMHAVR